MRHQVWIQYREDTSMTRSILALVLTFLFVLTLGGPVLSQDFILRDSDPAVVALSRDVSDTVNVFEDTNGDGIYDVMMLGDQRLTARIRPGDAQGFQYQDGRYIVLYPSDWYGLPEPGEAAILGFVHYFDDEYISSFLAVVAEQAFADDTTQGLGVFFYDSAGMRVGAPTTMFMEKARLRAVPIYQEWVQMNQDFGIGSNPINSQFFVLAKDLQLQDDILIVMYQLYQ